LIGVSGNINAYNDLQEWEFRIDAPASPPVLGCNSPPTGTMGVAYSHTLSTTGGTSPFYYVITAGSLPPGLYIGASDGTITGTPVTYGTYSFTATVTDNVSLSDDAACSITINPTTLGIACNTPPGGTVGLPYSHAFSASGGVTPYTFAITSGSLPSGITLSASTGTVSGNPTSAGTSTFTVRVTDDDGTTASVSCSIVISASAPTLTPSCNSPVDATQGTFYSHTFTVSGGTGPYTWLVIGGTLPPGLTLSSSGVVSGVPTTAGTFSFTLGVTGT